MLLALDFHLGPVQEFAVVGDPAADEAQAVLRLIHQGFRPRKVLALKGPATTPQDEELIPLLAGKTAAGAVTTYLCENFACQAPWVGALAAKAALAGGGP
jgi:uncharacterized protein YyaL (SSP411 family)